MADICEIEAIRRGLHVALVGRMVLEVHAQSPRAIRGLRGFTLTAVTRIAKAPILEFENVPFDPLFVACRLGTGMLRLVDGAHPDARALVGHKWSFWLSARPGEMVGPRLLMADHGSTSTIEATDARHRLAVFRSHGVDPLSDQFTLEHLARICSKPMMLHEILMRPELIPGLSPALASEVLFAARLNPERRSKDLTGEERERLAVALVRAIHSGVRDCGDAADMGTEGFKGRPIDDRSVHGRRGRPCHVCAHPVETVRLGRGTAHFCPACQPVAPRPANAVSASFVESLVASNGGGT